MSKYTVGGLLLLLSNLAFATPSVVSSIYPIQQIANAIVGEPTQLIADSYLSPHQYAIKPSKARSIMSADLVVWVGEVMMPQLDKYIKRRQGVTITAAELPQIKLLAADKHHHHQHNQDEHDDEDHHEMEQHHDAGEETLSYDPHLWLSTVNARVIARAIAEELIRQNPDNSQTYQHNLSSFEQQMNDLDQQLKQSLNDRSVVDYYVFHNAYRYFEDEFDIKNSGIIREHVGQTPKTRHLSDLKKQLRQSSKACLFREPQFNSPIVNKLVEGEKNITVAVLDPVGYSKQQQRGFSAILQDIADQMLHCKK